MLGDAFLNGRKLAVNPDGTVIQLTVRLFISYTGMDSLTDVNINITTPVTRFAPFFSFPLNIDQGSMPESLDT